MADVEGANELVAEFAAAGQRIGQQAAAVVRKTAQDVIATAQTFVPVDTGATKNSIGVDYEGDGRSASMAAIVGPTTEYAPHLEDGTVHAAPQAFMGPALDRHIPGFVEALAQIADLP